MSNFDAALQQIRDLLSAIGAERCEIVVRQDGRVYIEFADACTGFPRREWKRIHADLESDSAHGLPNLALHASVVG